MTSLRAEHFNPQLPEFTQELKEEREEQIVKKKKRQKSAKLLFLMIRYFRFLEVCIT
jgi:hypothetical protein